MKDSKKELLEINLGSNLKRELMLFIKENNIDYLSYYTIINDKTIRLFSVCKENLDAHFNCPELINLETNKKFAINEARKSEQTIFKTIENNERPLIKNVLYEAYIPVKLNKEILGCLYLGNTKNKIGDINLDNLKKIIEKCIYEICKILQIKISYYFAIQNTVFIHELFKYKLPSMASHPYNVAFWATQIAKRMNYKDEDLKKIYLASMLHDIGKLFIDEKILNKEGKLTVDEYNETKKHVQKGYNIVKALYFNIETDISKWILEHHERWDGEGYPFGLKGEEISEGGRILKIADAIDAMISKRSYKKRIDLKEAILELISCKSKDFDPYIVHITVEVLNGILNEYKQIIEETFLPARIIILGKNNMALDGFVFKENKDILFITNENINFEEKMNDKMNLLVEKLNMVHEFKIKAILVDSNKLLITELYPVESGTFSLLWTLFGELINTTTKQKKDIIISKISGENLIFNLEEDDYIDEKQVYIVMVKFEDGTIVPLKGIIESKCKISKITHYNFKFISIKNVDKHRDEVYRQLFRKQVMYRRLIAGLLKHK